MSFKVKRLTVGKGRTLEQNGKEWVRQYYEVELEIQDDRDLEIAKVSVESLIDGWLTAQPTRVTKPEKPKDLYTPDTYVTDWDPNQLEWLDKEGFKGPYEVCQEYDNPHHNAMLKDLETHGGKMTRDGLFYWLFEDGSGTVGRKKVKRKRRR